MRHLSAIGLALLPGLAAAQAEYELGIFAAMIEAPEGTPAATATVTGGSAGSLTYLTAASVAGLDGACVRIWDRGACHPVTGTRPLPGYDTLVLVDAGVSSEDMMAKAGSLRMTRMPLVGQYDPASGEGLSFMTQNALGGWEMPIAPVAPSGQSAGLPILRDAAITSLSAGAPVAHAEDGLVGLLARAGDGAGAVLPVADAFRAAVAAGVHIDDALMPRDTQDGGLPPRVASEIGRIYYFHDYSDLGYFGGFYGPSQGAGFDPSFVTTVDFSVWSVALSGAGGTKVAQGDKTVPLVGNGMALEAPFRGNAADYLASCIVHTTPSSEGRPVFLIQFWRSVPERYNPNVGSKSYDEAAPAMTGWVEGDNICSDAIGQMGAERLAALSNSGTAAARAEPEEAANPSEAPQHASVQGAWRRVETWQATGLEALFRDLPEGRLLTVGCTASGEFAIAVTPGDKVESIAGITPQRAEDSTRFILKAAATPGATTVVIDGEGIDIDIPEDIGPCG
ncbi:hypothetical protein [Salipiger mucosus]|uniref:Uncharacterized protein n=1 Tax=Salipiger mucosus DSM 16094 TaxID=1123237 RepID=S9RVW9_9RHOB|nr:hypothetical protein [Salipiger mucosus]EPX82145.1 hypothetical protein Salmuc_02514 [Salipiger mucosus DSM 16094]